MALKCPYTVEPAIFLFNFAHIMKRTATLDLVYSRTCSSSFDGEVCLDLQSPENVFAFESVQARSSFWIMMLQITLAVPAMLYSLYSGWWSDRLNRKMPVIITSIGEVLSTLVFLVVAYNPKFSLWFAVLGQCISGATGNMVGNLYAAATYIADSSSKETHTTRMAIIEGVFGVGLAIGPICSGLLVQYMSQSFLYLTSLCVGIIQFLYVLFLIESKPRPVRPIDDNNNRYLWRPFVESWRTIRKPRENGNRLIITLTIIIFFITLFILYGALDITYLFVKEEPLVWNYGSYSLFLTILFTGRVFGAVIILPLFKWWTSASDAEIIAVGIVGKIISYAVLGVAVNGTMMFIVAFLESFLSFIMAGCKAIISKAVAPDEHGKIFAFLAFLDNGTILFGSIAFNSLYPKCRQIFPGFMFECSSLILMLSLIVACAIMKLRRRTPVTDISETSRLLEDTVIIRRSSPSTLHVNT